MSLGNRILELQKKMGLSQEQLGEKVNVTRQTISNWELGETAPNPEQLKLLSQIFHISIDELLDNDISHVLVERVRYNCTNPLYGIQSVYLSWKPFGLMWWDSKWLLLFWADYFLTKQSRGVIIQRKRTVIKDESN